MSYTSAEHGLFGLMGQGGIFLLLIQLVELVDVNIVVLFYFEMNSKLM